MPRLQVLYLIAALLALSGCGIYQVVTIDAPQAGGYSTIDGTFRFTVTADIAEDAFRGFELYYKFYEPGQTISGGDDNLTSLALLQSHGFRRVSADTERTDNIDRPLIAVPMADRIPGAAFPYEVNIDFGLAEDGLEPLAIPADDQLPTPPANDPLPAPIPDVVIRRGIADNRAGFEDEFKPFTAFAAADADISGNPAIWAGQIVNRLPALVLLYVLSYGKDDTFQDVYSLPVFLGYIVVSFPIGQQS